MFVTPRVDPAVTGDMGIYQQLRARGWLALPREARWQQDALCAVAERRIKPAGKLAGLGEHIGWHTFRHTYRTWLDGTGANVSIQRELMRHASIQTTMNVYGRATMSAAKREANSKVVQMALRPLVRASAVQ